VTPENFRNGKRRRTIDDIVTGPDSAVHGVVNPGRENAVIQRGRFDRATGAVQLEGDHLRSDGCTVPFRVDGHLRGRTLRLTYRFGEVEGAVAIVRVEEYRQPRATTLARLKLRVAKALRGYNALFRPSGGRNRRALHERGESPESIVFRDAIASDIPALAELHVTTWNATYRTTRGPTTATRTSRWNDVFLKEQRADFVGSAATPRSTRCSR